MGMNTAMGRTHRRSLRAPGMLPDTPMAMGTTAIRTTGTHTLSTRTTGMHSTTIIITPTRPALAAGRCSRATACIVLATAS